MSSIAGKRNTSRLRRHRRVRKKVHGTGDLPRLCVYRSSQHIYAQIINDEEGRSICGASTLSPAIRGELTGLKKSDKSRRVGLLIARLAQEKGITAVAFDRGGNLYHGRIRALAEGAREGGLKF